VTPPRQPPEPELDGFHWKELGPWDVLKWSLVVFLAGVEVLVLVAMTRLVVGIF